MTMSLLPTPARADVEAVSIRFEAAGACPSEAEFLASVRSYTTRWTLVADGTLATRTIHVRVSGGAKTASGKLVVASADGAPSEREIAGPNCVAVSHALGVMVAVAIDPRAGMHDEPETKPDPPPDDPAPPPVIVTPSPVVERPKDVPESRSAPPASPSGHVRVSLDARAEVTTAVIDRALPALGVSMTIEPAGNVSSSWLRAWRPSLGIGLRQSLPSQKALEGGSADFLWTAGHLRACPFRLTIEAVVELSPCVEMNVGRLGASADGFVGAKAASMLWADIGASMWAAVNLSDRVFLSSTVTLMTPLDRRPFTLATGETIARVPPRGFLGGIGVGLRL
ncbi:hypothetical protein [Labilithrix luteola]|nr:hypothetical protein [Labilithrix luteola]